MEKEYKFVSKFVEGKTYDELTEEDKEKIKSGIGVKKEDKEYIDSLKIEENATNENPEEEKAEDKEKDASIIEENKKEEIKEEKKVIVEKVSKEAKSVAKKGIKVIQAMGRTLKLEDKRTVTLTKKDIAEKPFWRRGDVYYG